MKKVHEKINKINEELGKLLEGYLDPVQEFALRVDSLSSMMTTALAIAADMNAYAESYDDDLGMYREVIATIQDLLQETSDQVCAISEDLDEEYGDEDEEDDSEQEY